MVVLGSFSTSERVFCVAEFEIVLVLEKIELLGSNRHGRITCRCDCVKKTMIQMLKMKVKFELGDAFVCFCLCCYRISLFTILLFASILNFVLLHTRRLHILKKS